MTTPRKTCDLHRTGFLLAVLPSIAGMLLFSTQLIFNGGFFLLPHQSISFEDRAVAFIDVLGFSSLVNEAANDNTALDRLSKLVSLLESAVPALNKDADPKTNQDCIPTYTYISDCIILSAPLDVVEPQGYSGLGAVVMRSIQLSLYLIEHRYLIRGGISIGKVWHDPSNIVGPAYQEAFKLEKEAEDPVVLLSAEAVSHWHAQNRQLGRMCLRDGDRSIVNLHHDYYFPNKDQHGGPEKDFARYEKIVKEEIQRLDSMNCSKPRKKWDCFAKYLQMEAQTSSQLPAL